MENQTQTEPAIKLRVPSDFKTEVEAVAATMHISVSALARLALADFIRARKAEVAKTPSGKGVVA